MIVCALTCIQQHADKAYKAQTALLVDAQSIDQHHASRLAHAQRHVSEAIYMLRLHNLKADTSSCGDAAVSETIMHLHLHYMTLDRHKCHVTCLPGGVGRGGGLSAAP